MTQIRHILSPEFSVDFALVAETAVEITAEVFTAMGALGFTTFPTRFSVRAVSELALDLERAAHAQHDTPWETLYDWGQSCKKVGTRYAQWMTGHGAWESGAFHHDLVPLADETLTVDTYVKEVLGVPPG